MSPIYVPLALCVVAGGFALTLRYFDRAFVMFLTLAPLYYFPFLFIASAYSEETFLLRAGKDALMALVVAAWLTRVILRQRIRLWIDGAGLLAVIYVAFGTYTVVRLGASHYATTLRVFIAYAIFFFIARDVFRDRQLIQRQITAWMYVSGVVSGIGIIEFAAGGAGNVFSAAAGQVRIISTLFSPNALGWYLVFANALILGMLVDGPAGARGRPRRGALAGILVLNVVAIVFSGSRSAMLAFGAVFVSVLLFTKRAVVFKVVSIGLVGGLAVYAQLVEYSVDSYRVFGGLESRRWSLYSEGMSALATIPVRDVMFGSSSSYVGLLNYLGLLDDSSVLLLFAYGGLFACLIVAGVIAVGIRDCLISAARRAAGAVSGLFVCIAFAILAAVSNVLGIFPHALLFWVMIAMMSQLRRVTRAHGDEVALDMEHVRGYRHGESREDRQNDALPRAGLL